MIPRLISALIATFGASRIHCRLALVLPPGVLVREPLVAFKAFDSFSVDINSMLVESIDYLVAVLAKFSNVVIAGQV